MLDAFCRTLAYTWQRERWTELSNAHR